jgi:hypothetical protein
MRSIGSLGLRTGSYKLAALLQVGFLANAVSFPVVQMMFATIVLGRRRVSDRVLATLVQYLRSLRKKTR